MKFVFTNVTLLTRARPRRVMVSLSNQARLGLGLGRGPFDRLRVTPVYAGLSRVSADTMHARRSPPAGVCDRRGITLYTY